MNFVRIITACALSLLVGLAGCATVSHNPLDTPATRDAPPSPAKKAAAERLLQQESFVLESATASSYYTISFYPQKGEMRINVANRCHVGNIAVRFWVSGRDNIGVYSGSTKADCYPMHFTIDPVTGVAGGYLEKNGSWSTDSERFYLKRDKTAEMSATPTRPSAE